MSKTLLLVDDASIMRMMQRDIFTKSGYEIIGEAENGIIGVEKYKSLNPDMVILDIVMPEMNGIQALKKIKEYDNDAKVVICSAMGQPAMVIDALLAGASNFVVKPFQHDGLVEAVSRSFTEERKFNIDLLENLRVMLESSTDILSQNEINNLMYSARAGGFSKSELEESIANLGNKQKSEMKENDGSSDTKILDALNRLAQGQEEIKELLKRAFPTDK